MPSIAYHEQDEQKKIRTFNHSTVLMVCKGAFDCMERRLDTACFVTVGKKTRFIKLFYTASDK